MKSSASPQARFTASDREYPPWLASCMMAKPIPAVASASETVSAAASQPDTSPQARSEA